MPATKIIKTQQAWVVRIHVDKIDMHDLKKGEDEAIDMAFAALDKKIGMHSWLVDSRLDGSFWVIDFRPMGTHTCSRCELATTGASK